jgi:hypothetical protein
LVGASFCKPVALALLLVLLEGSLQELAFILLSGSETDIAENGTLLKEGGNQEHGIEVDDKTFLLEH